MIDVFSSKRAIRRPDEWSGGSCSENDHVLADFSMLVDQLLRSLHYEPNVVDKGRGMVSLRHICCAARFCLENKP